MPNRFDRDRDRDERNRGEFSAGPFARHGELGGYYARDTREDFGADYARDRGWSGGGAHDQYARDEFGRDFRSRGETRPTFRGRGPKNWRRPDERIREVVNELLTDHDGIDATDVEVKVENGEVTLEGHVGSRWEKRLAEDIAASCGGVHDVHNRLRVADREVQVGKASE
jgi:osmotically-inducible protein OsmY